MRNRSSDPPCLEGCDRAAESRFHRPHHAIESGGRLPVLDDDVDEPASKELIGGVDLPGENQIVGNAEAAASDCEVPATHPREKVEQDLGKPGLAATLANHRVMQQG